jgi:hypothetical protein
LVDTDGKVADENVAKFLKAFIDQFSAFAGKFAPQRVAAAA